jgi:hypothetical protein
LHNEKEEIMSMRFTRHKVWILYITIFLVVICLGAGGRTYAEEKKLACSEEIAKYCKEVKPGGGRLLTCLKEHERDLSTDCREKVAEIEKRLEEAKEICAGDTEKFCKEIQPGEGRIAKCLNEHIQEISPDCREKVRGLKQRMAEKKSEKQTGTQ